MQAGRDFPDSVKMHWTRKDTGSHRPCLEKLFDIVVKYGLSRKNTSAILKSWYSTKKKLELENKSETDKTRTIITTPDIPEREAKVKKSKHYVRLGRPSHTFLLSITAAARVARCN